VRYFIINNSVVWPTRENLKASQSVSYNYLAEPSGENLHFLSLLITEPKIFCCKNGGCAEKYFSIILHNSVVWENRLNSVLLNSLR
jgi:hypothetical protein